MEWVSHSPPLMWQMVEIRNLGHIYHAEFTNLFEWHRRQLHSAHQQLSSLHYFQEEQMSSHVLKLYKKRYVNEGSSLITIP